MKGIRLLALSILAVAALGGCGGDDPTGPNGNGNGNGSSDLDFEWTGSIAAGDRIEIKGVLGEIAAAATSGSQVEVRATKSAQLSDPAGVTIEVVEHSEGVTICAVYPDVPGEPPNECLPGDEGNNSVQDNDVQVDFVVSVPAGVVFVGRNFSGNVEAIDLESDVFASTFSGNVTVSTTEIAEAATFSGNVTATIGRANWGRDLEFTTFSGNVDVEVPSNTNAEVLATTVSGVIDSDFLLTGTPNQQQGTLGSGGPTLTLVTFSGNIRLRSGPES
jgi:hypothetical protein